MAVKEGFELLDIKGVDRKVQHLFSDVLYEDKLGRLWVGYKDGDGKIIDQEILSLSKLKLSSGGILHFSTAHPLSVRTLYISDSVANLIFFVQSYASRFSWDYVAFIATGAKLERNLFTEAVGKHPHVKKHYAVFGRSLIGRVRDCKVQHWLMGEECSFRMEGDVVVSCYQNKQCLLPIKKFSLRNHLRQVMVRQSLATRKPKISYVENFIDLNCNSLNSIRQRGILYSPFPRYHNNRTAHIS